MADAIQIQVNGETAGLPVRRHGRGSSSRLDIKTERVAVELNLEILDRKDFDHRSLKEGDRVEILSFIGGGGLAVARADREGCRPCMMIGW